MLQRITTGFKRPLDRKPLSRFRGRNASVILMSFYCVSLVLIKSVLIKPVLIKSFEMKRPFMVCIGFISICCSKVAKEGKSYPRLLVLQRVAQNAKSCSKVAEHKLFMPKCSIFVISQLFHAVLCRARVKNNPYKRMILKTLQRIFF